MSDCRARTLAIIDRVKSDDDAFRAKFRAVSCFSAEQVRKLTEAMDARTAFIMLPDTIEAMRQMSVARFILQEHRDADHSTSYYVEKMYMFVDLCNIKDSAWNMNYGQKMLQLSKRVLEIYNLRTLATPKRLRRRYAIASQSLRF